MLKLSYFENSFCILAMKEIGEQSSSDHSLKSVLKTKLLTINHNIIKSFSFRVNTLYYGNW